MQLNEISQEHKMFFFGGLAILIALLIFLSLSSSDDSQMSDATTPAGETQQGEAATSIPDTAVPAAPTDTVIASGPGTVELGVILSNGLIPTFPVFATFVGADQSFEEAFRNGRLVTSMPEGRYSTEITINNSEYVLNGNPPSFSLLPGEQKNLGIIQLKVN
jgi:hypothetical protein